MNTPPLPSWFSLLLLSSAFPLSLAAAPPLDWAGDATNTADNGFLAPSQPFILSVDSRPRGAASGASVSLSTNAGASWSSFPMAHHGLAHYDSTDRWTLDLGRFPEGASLLAQIHVASPDRALDLPPFTASVRNANAPIRWIGDLRTDPPPDALAPGQPLVVHSRMSPPGVATDASLGVSTNNGASWRTVFMSRGEPSDGMDSWSARLGPFPAGAHLRFFIRARNARGDAFWDSNTGADYRLRVLSPIRDVYSSMARHAPGETATLHVDLLNPGPDLQGALTLRIRHLDQVVAMFQRDVSLPQHRPLSLSFPWKTPPADFQGYGVDVNLVSGRDVIDSRSSALDVSSDWTRFPRMGFFCDYPPGDDPDAKAAALARFHLNAIQFYDWKWTHDRLVPYRPDGLPADRFTQVGGRVQSFRAVRDKVAALHDRNIAALSYTLMYGDSGEGAPEHPEWAAYSVPFSSRPEDIRTHDAGPYRIWIMDVSNPDWKRHLFAQCLDAIDKAGFDGIHFDNLGGAWSYPLNSNTGISEREEFPRFLAEARAALRAVHPDARVSHNDVAENYFDQIVRSDVDLYYSEVWGRDTYADLRDLVRRARDAGKSVVLAAYVNRRSWDDMAHPVRPPLPTHVNDASVKLLDACLFANGAFHIELGEDAQMLVNEYFPLRSPRIHPGLQRSLRDYYDFAVRYQNLLAFDPASPIRDASDDLRISSETHPLGRNADGGTLWPIARLRDDGLLALNLINLSSVDPLWRNPTGNPTPQTRIALQIHGLPPTQRILFATPDDGLGRAREIPFKKARDASGPFISFTVPRLDFWDLLLISPIPPPPPAIDPLTPAPPPSMRTPATPP